MSQRNLKFNKLFNVIYFFSGISIGLILIWPGILKTDNRECFYKIIVDGSDGKVTMGTILSIDPNSLIKIKNAKNKYKKILLIGDHCFRK
tara:strand:- start:243 stop:512 length:270 start_codon:yes stop_codon:yes gene_type:complete